MEQGKVKLGAGPVRLGCVEGMGQMEGGRGQTKRIELRRLLEAEPKGKQKAGL